MSNVTASTDRPVLDGFEISTAQAANFWEQVNVISQGCWLWTGGVSKDGYGIIRLQPGSNGTRRVHRVAWTLTKGAIPDGLVVRHGPQCEELPGWEGRRCVNPDHLQIGTHAENMADRNSGWFRLDLDDIPMDSGLRDAAKAFMPHAQAIEDGPDVPDKGSK